MGTHRSTSEAVTATLIEVDGTMFVDHHQKRTRGLWCAYLLIRRSAKRGKRRVRDCVELRADTRDELDAKVADYVESPNVVLREPGEVWP
jgi:hypothetical protein